MIPPQQQGKCFARINFLWIFASAGQAEELAGETPTAAGKMFCADYFFLDFCVGGAGGGASGGDPHRSKEDVLRGLILYGFLGRRGGRRKSGREHV